MNQPRTRDLTRQVKSLKDQLAQQHTMLLALGAISTVINTELDLNRIFQIVAEYAQRLIKSETLLVPILNESHTEYTYRGGSGRNVEEIIGETLSIETGICGWVLHNKRAWWHGVLKELDEAERNRWEKEARHVIIVPLLGRHHFLGGLAGINKVGRQDFNENDFELLTLFAQHVSSALENANLFRELKTEIEHRKEKEDTLNLLTQVVEQSPNIVIMTTAKNEIEYVNPAFTNVMGYRPSEVEGKHPDMLVSENTDPDLNREILEHVTQGKHWQGEITQRKKNGEEIFQQVTISPVFSEDQTLTHHVYVQEDISERKRYEEKLIQQATFDPLTGLPNRRLGRDRLQQAVEYSRRTNKKIALMYLDLDHFKAINDTLGHAFGDLLLIEAAKRLQCHIRKSDTVARLGGDEFLVVLVDVQPKYIYKIADKIRHSLADVFDIHGHELYVGCSIGITIAPDDGCDAETLIRNADAAMYHAKEDGRDKYKCFTQSMEKSMAERLSLDTDLHYAFEHQEFELYYQPIQNIKNGHVESAEALMRWKPKDSFVSPGRFIPALEDNGLIVKLGPWLLSQACREAKQWNDQSHFPISVSVNISYVQFRQAGFAELVDDVLHQTGLEPENLHLEIPERLILEDDVGTIKCLNVLHEMGVKFSIDDFGTGYSSLSSLKRFPTEYVKIDRSFIQDSDTDSDDAAMVQAVIQMGHSLSRQIIAEGVEKKSQVEFLKSLECEYIQGYLLSKPLPQQQFEEMLKAQELKSAYN